MDLPLWDLSDDQDYLTSFKSNYRAGDIWECGHYSGYGPDQSGYYTEDEHSLCEFPSLGYGRDIMEEDALNEKSCVQVLKILMDKADEEIVKLEEDIVMLQCQLAWDDEDWSKQCSAALREKIDHLDILIQSLKKENTEDVHYFGLQLEQPEKLAQRLHDLLKPLLENYFLVKSKQTERSITQMPALPVVGLDKKKTEASTSKDDKKIEEKECTIMLKTNERKSQSKELKERKTNHPQQKKDAVISKFTASAHKCATDKLSKKDINKTNRLQGRRMPNLAPVKSGRGSSVKSEPSNPMAEDSSASMSIESANSRERKERRNNDKEVICKAKVTQRGLEHESKVTNSHLKLRETETQISETVKVDRMKQRTEASSKVRKARAYRHAINKNVLHMKPSVKTKGKRTKFPEITEASVAQETEMKYSSESFNDRTKHARKPKMKLEHQIQVHQGHEIETLVINQAKTISSLKPEGQGPQKKCKAAPAIVQNSYLAENIDRKLSSAENMKGQQKYRVLEKISKNGNKETQQQLNGNNIDGTSEVTVTSISSPQKVRKLSFSSQTIWEKKGLRNMLMKLAKMECDTSNSTTDEATDGVEDVPQNSSECIKDVEKLTLKDLKIIAKNQKLPGYSKLRKEELQKRLGLESLYLQ